MTSSPHSAHAEIDAVAAELLAAVNAGDVARVVALWSADGVLMPPHHPAVHGRAAIEAYFRALFARRRLTFAFTDSERRLLGDHAVERLAFTAVAVPVSGGQPAEDAGKGVHVYARGSDGAWRLALDIWNSDRPLA